MYSPKFNQVADRGLLIEAMRAYSFAILFGPLEGIEAAGSPSNLPATHLPLVVRDEGEHGLVEGHFAKANRHWQALAGRETLIVFPGPHSYVSPTLYTEQLSVPTLNYIAVHAYGTLELVEDEVGKEVLLAGLIEANDPAYAEQWRGMPDGFRRTMLSGIVGFRMPIARIEGKFKMSQNRTPQERANVQAAHAAGDDDRRALAVWMSRLSKYPPAEPVALRLLAPQRGLTATVRSKSKNKCKSLVLLSSLPQHRPFERRHTPGILKVLLPPRQSRGISLLD